MSGGNGGPPNKWIPVKIDGLTGQQQADALSAAAKQGYYQTPIVTDAIDGTFVQVANYNENGDSQS